MKKIKKWFKETALPWLKKSWLQILNVFMVLLAYGKFDDLANGQEINAPLMAGIIGFWGFILLAYWIFWKFFGLDKMIKQSISQKRK